MSFDASGAVSALPFEVGASFVLHRKVRRRTPQLASSGLRPSKTIG